MPVSREDPDSTADGHRPGSFPPGSTIGIFGSGQLGRMMTQAAQRLGYRVHVYSPYENTPTGMVADREYSAPYEDLTAVEEFAAGVDIVTLEFENVPVESVDAAARFAPVRPSSSVLHTVQNRLREKTFLRNEAIACTPFRTVHSKGDLQKGLEEFGYPAILKTAQDGYDGKGQQRIENEDDATAGWEELGPDEAILESFVDLQCELSILAARGVDGSIATYGPVANAHANHILDVAVMPHPSVEAVRSEAADVVRTIVDRLEVNGIICVEFFLTRGGELLVNEIAPRPHNSGHLTIDACVSSQFEQHVRAICGLPLACSDQLRPAAMANLLGDLWDNGEPDWRRALEIPQVKLHLYGKREARPGRKMGHLTALADSPEEAETVVRAARDALANS